MSNQNNAPVILSSAMQGLVATPPPELIPLLDENFRSGEENFTSSFRTISFRGNQFHLREGSDDEIWPDKFLPVVILGMAPDTHCVWYEGAFTGGDNSKPTAVWYTSDGAPSIVPASVLQKDANGRNQYQIKQRLVVAVMRQNPENGSMYIDLDRPFIMDISSTALYGNDYPNQMAFSFGGLMRLCKRLTVPGGAKIRPLHFLTKVVFDPSSTVPSVRFVPANQNGQVIYLDADSLQHIYRVATSSDVANLLKVRTLPETGAAITQNVAQETSHAPVQPVQPQTTAPSNAAAAQTQPLGAAPVVASQVPTAQPDIMQQAAAAAQAAQATVAQAAPQQEAPAPQPAPTPAPQTASQTASQSGESLDSALNDLLTSAGAFGA